MTEVPDIFSRDARTSEAGGILTHLNTVFSNRVVPLLAVFVQLRLCINVRMCSSPYYVTLQPYGPSRPVTGIALPLPYILIFLSTPCIMQQ
jgi:hypothetical protein